MVIQVAMLAFTAINTAITAHKQKLQEAREAAVEFYNTSKETANKEREKADALEEAKEKYEEIYKTTKDYEERQQKLTSLNSELKGSLGDVADTLNIVSGSYENTTKKMDEYIKKQEEVVKKTSQTEYDSAKSTLAQGAPKDARYTMTERT